MNVRSVLEQFNRLQEQGFGDEEVVLDTNPIDLLNIGSIEHIPDIGVVFTRNSLNVEPRAGFWLRSATARPPIKRLKMRLTFIL